MTVDLSPSPPKRRLSGAWRSRWSVAVDGKFVGWLEEDASASWWWCRCGMTDAMPARFGLRMNALDELLTAANLPSGFRHTGIRRESSGRNGGPF